MPSEGSTASVPLQPASAHMRASTLVTHPPKRSNSSDMDSGSASQATPTSTTTTTPARPHLNILDLPEEVQKAVFRHCSQSDLICASLVCKEFRDLAAAELYRNFYIVFPDEDDPYYDSPIDSLAGGLDTFVSSDYDYGKHLRDLSLDTYSSGDKAETAYKAYLYSASCGKFLNTLLHMTLKKTKYLEAFRWNVRVELNRRVYKQLHEINTLKVLHIRLQAGPSLYETPPPLPIDPETSNASSLVTTITYHLDPLPPPPPSLFPGPPPTFSLPNGNGAQLFYVAPQTSMPPPPPLPPPKIVTRHRQSRRTPSSKEPPTLSGFKNLKSLSVLDIDNLDIVAELKACVRNSARTLTRLEIGFSDYLGSQARKPSPDVQSDDSDVDEEYEVGPDGSMTPLHDDVGGSTRAYRAQEEKKSQENVLGRIFDVEPCLVKKPSASKPSRRKELETVETPTTDPGQEFITSLKQVSEKMWKHLYGTDELSVEQQEVLDLIESAAKKYVESNKAPPEDTAGADGPAMEGSSSSAPRPNAELAPGAVQLKPASSCDLFGDVTSNSKGKQKETSPDDIIIEQPLEHLSLESGENSGSSSPVHRGSTPVPEASPSGPSSRPTSQPRPLEQASFEMEKAVQRLQAQRRKFKTLASKLQDLEERASRLNKDFNGLLGDNIFEQHRLLEAEKRELGREILEIQRLMDMVEVEAADAEKQMSSSDKRKDAQQSMGEYLRSTRGVALETLCIYLVPVKASILSKAVDIRVLKRLTLLNVGPQTAIWTHFHRANKESALPLRAIFTDNVTVAFLNFVSSLDEVHDLFMLERGSKYRPESFASKTSVEMSQIRRLVLKKHIRTLRRLMIKNQAGTSWDLDEKSVQLICGRGQALRELACSMSIRRIHTLMQRIAGLSNLVALHIISLRNEDTCAWVIRETKQFLIDNLTHHPEMKLEWISIDEGDKVDRLVRDDGKPGDDDNDDDDDAADDGKEKGEKKSSKSKGKQTAAAAPVPSVSVGNGSVFPVFPPLDGWGDGYSDSDEDEGGPEPAHTIIRFDGIRFYDVGGNIEIFKKETVSGRL